MKWNWHVVVWIVAWSVMFFGSLIAWGVLGWLENRAFRESGGNVLLPDLRQPKSEAQLGELRKKTNDYAYWKTRLLWVWVMALFVTLVSIGIAVYQGF